MNVYELMNLYWAVSEEKPFSPSETAMYFFLLYKANAQHWQMPVVCPTTTICLLLGMTKQNVMKVRSGLVGRGLITVERGKDKHRAAAYTLVLPTCNRQPNSQQIRQPNRQIQLSDELTLYKDNKTEDNNHNNNARENELKGISELKTILMKDEAWQMSVINALGCTSVRTPEDISSQLSQFFLMLEAQGVKRREERDCRAYFFNWLNKRANGNNSNYGNRQQTKIQAQRRGVEVSVGATKNYEGRF